MSDTTIFVCVWIAGTISLLSDNRKLLKRLLTEKPFRGILLILYYSTPFSFIILMMETLFGVIRESFVLVKKGGNAG